MSIFGRIFHREQKQEAPSGPEAIESRAFIDGDVRGMPSNVTIDIIGEKSCLVSISILLSYIRYYLNTGGQGDITLKIGYNKPPSVPFSFTVNEQLLDDIYPGDTIEIN